MRLLPVQLALGWGCQSPVVLAASSSPVQPLASAQGEEKRHQRKTTNSGKNDARSQRDWVVRQPVSMWELP